MLRGAARRRHDEDEPGTLLLTELAQSTELLLLSPIGDQVLAELLRTLRDDRAVFDLALNGFVGACKRTGQDEPYGRPLVLDWYTRATAERPEAARATAEMWRAALGGRVHTGPALDVPRRWVLAADRDPAAEWALAALLPALVTSAPEHRRIDHLLRTMPGEDGARPPPAAGRLLTVLPPADRPAASLSRWCSPAWPPPCTGCRSCHDPAAAAATVSPATPLTTGGPKRRRAATPYRMAALRSLTPYWLYGP